MKKFTKFLVSGLLIVGGLYGISQHTNNETQVAEAATPTTLYLDPNSNWEADSARFAAYFFEGESNTWVSMTDSDCDTIYEVTVPSGFTSVIFCRMDPSTSTNNWNNKWNQTGDLTIPTDGTNQFKIDSGEWEKGSWSTYDQFANIRAEVSTYEDEGTTISALHFSAALKQEGSNVPALKDENLYHFGFQFDFLEKKEKDVSGYLYLKPNSNWEADSARFAAYFFGNDEKWVSMSDSDGDGLYEVAKPSGFTSVIFCRMDPSTSTNNWNNKWNQTGDLTIPTNGNNTFTVTSGSWDGATSTWSKTTFYEDSITTKKYTLTSSVKSVSFNDNTITLDENNETYLSLFEVYLNNIPSTFYKVKVTTAYAYGEAGNYSTQEGVSHTFYLSNGLLA